MQTSRPQQFVAVFDFGAQYGQLIARRVRDLNVYSEMVPCDISADELAAMAPAAIILSGGPASVYADDAPDMDGRIFELGVPILGFCYGQQIMAVKLGGKVGHIEKGEYGPAELCRCGESRILAGTPGSQTVWMSHRDAVSDVPAGFSVTSTTETCPIASMEDASRRFYATQFHPEVRHTACGQAMLENFLFGICGLGRSWTMDNIIDEKVAEIREQVGGRKVILALSGGVDSSVVAALVHRAIGDQLTCVFVNHGLLRKGEPEMVEEVFREQFNVPLVHVHAEERYLRLLAGVSDPEQKRRLIGGEFWKVFFEEAQKIGDVEMLAQGTIYPDIIESGARKTGGKASTIKSHHNLIPFPEGCASTSSSRWITSSRTRSARWALPWAFPPRWSGASPSPAPASPFASLARSRPRSSTCCARRTPSFGRSSTPTTGASSRRRETATASTAAGSTSPCCPTSALWV